MATHAGVALELGIVRPQEGKARYLQTGPQTDHGIISCRSTHSFMIEGRVYLPLDFDIGFK